MKTSHDARATSSASRQAKIGFVLSSEQFPVTELIELGKAAETAGFDLVWSSDHFQPWQDNQGNASLAWLTLSALGQHSQRLTMGTGVTCPSYRYHPSVVAEAFATLGMLYPGRIFLGVGAGEALNEQAATGEWGDYEERAARLAEAIDLIRQLWSGERIDFAGRYFKTTRARLYNAPARPIPIYVAASGPKSMRLAGEKGDGLIADAKRIVQQDLWQAFEEGARSAGNDASKMPLVSEHMVVVGGQSEAEKYARLWRFMPKSWEKYVNDPDPLDIQQQAEQEVPLQEVYKDWPVSEDPSVHIQALQKLVDQGITHIFVHSPQADQRRVIRFYSEQVLPHVERVAAR